MDGEQEHLSGYQARDWEYVDYEMYQDEETGLWFRGPRPVLEGGNYFTCVGAAQTFGCFCPEPYPELLSRQIGLPVLNLGYGGAGPSFFLKYPKLIDRMNRGRFVVLQVMSGRSESNGAFDSGGLEYLIRRDTGERVSSDDAYADLLSQHALPESMPPKMRKAIRMFHGPPPVKALVEETLDNWVESYEALLDAIKKPVVLAWISTRSPRLHKSARMVWWWRRYDSVQAMFGAFPQLIGQRQVSQIASRCASYVECVSERGFPQLLVSRFTGDPTPVDCSKDRPDFQYISPYNSYYPSPEMQEDLAAQLAPVCQQMMKEDA
ncbi:MAG TPA: DUF6473 family protein [Hyphomonas sp.]|nr:hypothetical protein [Hyphomonas sp.]MCB9960530.1 hypothetical protein [Hyphomonas sp.]MCB9972797.1 hypothetical protein [Hyphomonas sp.]HPE47616.1 DUF6473 family protein [Hyphomonas sp.]